MRCARKGPSGVWRYVAVVGSWVFRAPSRSCVQALADTIASYFVPAVVAIAMGVLALWMVLAYKVGAV